MNSRVAFRNVLQGKNNQRPPFAPFLYGLAARIANVSLRDMASNASYYTNALEGVCGLFGPDVIVGNFDATLECESFGCEIEWPGEFTAPTVVKGGDFVNLRPEDFVRSGRIPVLMEVTKRLTISLGRDTAITCALIGPCSFLKNFQMPSEGIDAGSADESIKLLGSYYTKLVRSLCELKVDALFFREDLLAQEFVGELFQHKEAYKALYRTLFNIIRAFNGFPILVVKNCPLEEIKDVHGLLRPSSMVFLGDTFFENDLLFIKDIADSLKMSFGVPLSIGTGKPEELWNQLSLIESFVSTHRPKNLFYTSDGEIPSDVAMEILHTVMDRLRSGSGS